MYTDLDKRRKYHREYYKKYRAKKLALAPEQLKQETMFWSAKERSAKYGIEFTINKEDIVIPNYCPILKIPIECSIQGKVSDNSPSLDRINPSLGYIKDNIHVISFKANTMKSSATPIELLAFSDWIRETYDNS